MEEVYNNGVNNEQFPLQKEKKKRAVRGIKQGSDRRVPTGESLTGIGDEREL
jgi:Cys-tRNA synthase (O-phospho-L-seryl-tRNA:Cys-tRNA synthase)